jgi:predicted Fe-S protein YdhL (DUF1289 family)
LGEILPFSSEASRPLSHYHRRSKHRKRVAAAGRVFGACQAGRRDRQCTGCGNFRLAVIAWLGPKEADEIIEYYGLDDRVDGRVRDATQIDQGR